ncbi:MAG TPA: alpha-L-arabinofuranosidase C-terminal domain-containing protein [Gammaproteobacteria bacterium]|nr:alpha-L-arabinofuranosidase C-terminal domain-containing protein [Gammaproteobacteria bacterium]
MKLTRRTVVATALASPLILRAAAAADDLSARIKVNTENTRGPIDPKLWGNFIEHLGRCIDGGVFQEGSKLSDASGYRRDVLEAAQGLGVSLLRWPGGNFSSNYHWMDGIGPRDDRPPRLELAWGTVESNRFGTHEFLDYAERLKTEPYICANLGTGTWTEAQQWVEYCNSSLDTAVTRLRRKNGRNDPWKVTYWGLGNEMDGPWQMGHRTADDYGKFALEAAKLMRLTDPSVKLIAAGSSNYAAGVDWALWNRTVVEHLQEYIDYLAIHLYVGNPNDDFGEFLASSRLMDDKIETTAKVIDGVLAGRTDGKKVHIAFDEYNVWYRERGASQRGRRILEERYNLEDALVIATLLSSLVNHADVVKIANMAQLVNVIAPIFTSDEGLFLQTIYYPLQLFAKNVKGESLKLEVDVPSYTTKQWSDVPYLDVSGAIDGDTLLLNVVNRHQDQAIDTTISLDDKSFAGALAVAEVNGPDIKAVNDFGKTLVRAESRPAAAASGKAAQYRFPPHSFTQLKARLA